MNYRYPTQCLILNESTSQNGERLNDPYKKIYEAFVRTDKLCSNITQFSYAHCLNLESGLTS